jgi:hypothetical protein
MLYVGAAVVKSINTVTTPQTRNISLAFMPPLVKPPVEGGNEVSFTS